MRITGEGEREARPGQAVDLDASGTTDPEGDELDFSWGVYPADPDVASKIEIDGKSSPQARIVVPPGLEGETIPILLSVTDRGEPNLTCYGRILIKVGRAE